MRILTLAQACAQCRVDPDYPPEQLQPYMDGAESMASAYLNRSIFADQASLDAARAMLPQLIAAANEDYATALVTGAVAGGALCDPERWLAQVQWDEAHALAARVMYGMVVNGSILAAMLLTLGQLFAYREDVISAEKVAVLPNGARALLRPFRRTMTP